MKTFEELTKDEKLELIEAFLDGEEVEIFCGSWKRVQYAAFFPKNCYRIAPPTPDYIDWEHVHPKYKYMARDEDGAAYLYVYRPIICYDDSVVWNNSSRYFTEATSLFSSYRKGTVNWKNSLVTRPQGETK